MTSEKFCQEHSGVCGKINAIKREIELRFQSLEKAIASTKNDLDIRLASMNEFRAQLDRQSRTFVPRKEIELTINKLEEKIDLLLARSSEKLGSTKWVDHIITVLIGMAVIFTVWMIKG